MSVKTLNKLWYIKQQRVVEAEGQYKKALQDLRNVEHRLLYAIMESLCKGKGVSSSSS